jgi:hypothetical protein
MAKDPAVLFYTQDFLVGTITMNYEERGKYITLLCLQHQKGKLTEKDLKKIITDEDIEVLDKFPLHSDGFYYNERMYEEGNKRKSYTESRRNNRKGKTSVNDKNDLSTSYVKLMENENEDVNVNVNDNTNEDVIESSITTNMVNRLVDKFINISDRFRFQSFLHEVKDYGGWDNFLELYSKGDTSVKKNFTNQLNQYNNGIFQNKQY